MRFLHFGDRPYPVRPETRWRYRFSVLAVVTTTALLGWGAFVTSINAGMAVPDWPTSFNSLDPFNPWPAWWTLTPVLAEHGHRLLGALVGLLTVVLSLWTWRADPRPWMRRLGFAALALVIFQGVLGGMRVVLVSLDLAVVHACVAQVFFSTLAGMALFASPGWLQADGVLPDGPAAARMRRLAAGTAAVLYGQIILGALLRHPGTGIDPLLVTLHIGGATVSTLAIGVTWLQARRQASRRIRRAGHALLALLVAQVTLGFTAYLVTLDEAGRVQASNLQVVVNTTHMVVGALLMAAAVRLVLLAHRFATTPAPVAAGRHRAPIVQAA
jgi:cytochrome c oxidase assembly protein subunit 15